MFIYLMIILYKLASFSNQRSDQKKNKEGADEEYFSGLS